MSEQTMTRSSRQRLGPDPIDDSNDVWAPDQSPGLADVGTGLYLERLPVVGMTVADIRTTFADRLDIHPEATAVLDGERITDESTRIGAGQHLAFVRYSGEKGSCP